MLLYLFYYMYVSVWTSHESYSSSLFSHRPSNGLPIWRWMDKSLMLPLLLTISTCYQLGVSQSCSPSLHPSCLLSLPPSRVIWYVFPPPLPSFLQPTVTCMCGTFTHAIVFTVSLTTVALRVLALGSLPPALTWPAGLIRAWSTCTIGRRVFLTRNRNLWRPSWILLQVSTQSNSITRGKLCNMM